MLEHVPGIFVLGEHVAIAWYGENGEWCDVMLDTEVCATYLRIIDTHGFDHALAVALATFRMSQAVTKEPIPSEAYEQQVFGVIQSLRALDLHRAQLAERDYELLEASYYALRAKTWTRAEAADIAATMLGREITTEAWRKAVDRWAEKQGLPKVEIYKRKAVKTDTVS
jgi:hypothetical protein